MMETYKEFCKRTKTKNKNSLRSCNETQKPKQHKTPSQPKREFNPLGEDDSAYALLKTLRKERNVCIGIKRYHDIIASYKKLFMLKDDKEAERIFIQELSTVCDFTCSIRYAEPKENYESEKIGIDSVELFIKSKSKGRPSKSDAGFYVIEEV